MPGNGHGGFGGRQRGKEPVPGALAALPTLRDLTPEQRGSLASLSKTNSGLYRAYLLKEQLRLVFSTKGETGRELLAGWLAWARRSQLPGFVALAATIKRFQQLIFKVSVDTDRVDVFVVACYQEPLTQITEQVAETLAGVLAGRALYVHIEDIVMPGESPP